MASRRRSILPVALAVISIAFFARGLAYYRGSGPHDGEDLPSFAMVLLDSASPSPRHPSAGTGIVVGGSGRWHLGCAADDRVRGGTQRAAGALGPL